MYVAALIAMIKQHQSTPPGNFDGLESSDPDGDEVSFEWNFGEDERVSSRDNKTSYTYSTIGKFTTTLTVTDMKGFKAKISIEVDVEEYPKSLVAFQWSSGEACNDERLKL
eukprot:scaffold108092_cov59-Attheya_sp.AAC.1